MLSDCSSVILLTTGAIPQLELYLSSIHGVVSDQIYTTFTVTFNATNSRRVRRWSVNEDNAAESDVTADDDSR
jgi:hypothetical protein